jgi:hypothetical protein
MRNGSGVNNDSGWVAVVPFDAADQGGSNGEKIGDWEAVFSEIRGG